jgi:hypothetical protein
VCREEGLIEQWERKGAKNDENLFRIEAVREY